MPVRHPRSAPLAAALILLGAALFGASPAGAVTLSFGCITGNLAGDCAIGEAQLSVLVQDLGAKISFTFNNEGPDPITINAVYFDDGTLLGIASVVSSGPGVSFMQGATPPDLPGGDDISPPFNVTAGFLADADPPPAIKGVDPGEWVAIIFDLQAGGTLADVIAELTDGRLRIGIHAIAFSGGGSESFVNFPVPEPGTALLLAGGLAGLAARNRRV